MAVYHLAILWLGKFSCLKYFVQRTCILVNFSERDKNIMDQDVYCTYVVSAAVKKFLPVKETTTLTCNLLWQWPAKESLVTVIQ